MNKSPKEKFKTKENLQNMAELFSVLGKLKGKELSSFYADLITENEAIMLAKRFKVASALLLGESYLSIQKKYNVTPNTISETKNILKNSNGGFKKAFEIINLK